MIPALAITTDAYQPDLAPLGEASSAPPSSPSFRC